MNDGDGIGCFVVFCVLAVVALLWLVSKPDNPKSYPKVTVVKHNIPKPIVTASPATPILPKPTEDNSCLRGETAEVQSAYAEKRAYSDGDDWESFASLKTRDGLTVVCTFDHVDLTKLWKAGMMIRSRGGEREIGTYNSDKPQPKPSPTAVLKQPVAPLPASKPTPFAHH